MTYRNTFHWVIRTQPWSTLFLHGIAALGIVYMMRTPPDELGWRIFLWAFIPGILAAFWLASRRSFRSKKIKQ